jgi:hypothetical protein
MAVAKKTKVPGTTTARRTDSASAGPSRGARIVAIGIVAGAVVVTIAAVFVFGKHHHPSSPASTVKSITPTLFTASALESLAGQLNQPIYWIGPVEGDRYEVTRTAGNDIYVRYLPLGVDAGSRQGRYLLVATYPLYRALTSLKATAFGHALRVKGARGAIAVVETGKRTNVRVAFPNIDYQVEVFDPSPKKAKALATSGALTPVP